MPLNWDGLTELIVYNLGHPAFLNFYGALDAGGSASASLHVPDSAALLCVGCHVSYLSPVR